MGVYEFSIFGVHKPQGHSIGSASYVDLYLYASPSESFKVRCGSEGVLTAKYKLLIRHDPERDIDYFDHTPFNTNPKEDPLRSFLELHRISWDLEAALSVRKTRTTFNASNAVVLFTELEVAGQETTNLTISARHPDALIAVREQLGLTQRNLNYGAYLRMHVVGPK